MDKNHLVEEEGEGKSLNFIEQIIEEELAAGKNGGRVRTRFPPEPNGYLHIGHATSICLNFGIAAKYNGKCNLRFDDTNPSKEDVEYIDSIQQDIRWLGFQWEGKPHYASDYFQQLYDWAEKLIVEGKAYVDDQPAEVISAQRMTPTEPGVNSPYRDRSPEENIDLFRRMKAGEVKNGEKVLRAKIDMASPNMLMRDPIMYRIMHTPHHRTGDKWCIYPMYDFTHGQSDYIEGITHSICTLEFEVHRPLYNWFLDQLIDTEYRPRQIEFARRNLSYTVMSKRRLLELVQKGIVAGWDDPRMPTISGLRRAGYTPEAIRLFAEKVGVARREIVVDMALLEFCAREHLNKVAPRVMAVLNPVKVVIDNYPEGQSELVEVENNPEDETAGTRQIPFSRALYIEQRGPPQGSLHREMRGRGKKHRRRHHSHPLRLRPGNPERIRSQRQPESEGHPPLGVGPRRHRGRSASLRPPLQRPRPRRTQGRGLQGIPQREFPPSAAPLQTGAKPAFRERGRPLPIPTPGILLRGQRLPTGSSGVQSHRRTERHMGKTK